MTSRSPSAHSVSTSLNPSSFLHVEHEMSSCPHAGGVIRIGVVGPRGGGKTTLLYSLLGQVTGYDLEFVVQGGRVTAMVKAMASVSLSDTGPAVPLFKTLVFEELSADDNGFIAVRSLSTHVAHINQTSQPDDLSFSTVHTWI